MPPNMINGKKGYYKFNEFEYNTDCKERLLSEIRTLDLYTSGFELGCITLWTGITNSGKTTILTMLAKNTIKQKEKVFFFNGEQTKEDFKNNLYKQSVKKESIYEKQYKDSCVFDSFVRDNEVQILNKKYGDSLFVFNNELPRTIDNLIYVMNECNKLYGVKCFILDNFMQIDLKSENIFQEQTVIMEKLRTFAINNKVHIHLVAHPRKIERMQTRLTLYDISGSMNLANKAYNIISIMRIDNMDVESAEYRKLALDLLKARYDIKNTNTALEVLKTKGKECGLVGLIYEPERKTYAEQKTITFEEAQKLKYEYMAKDKRGGSNCPF